ncbi:hypothetical protein ACJZ2D_007681 [Fusarium nematophilum]
MHLRRTSDGDLESSLSYDPLDGVNALWHPRQIDILSLKRLASYKGRVKEVEFEGKTALSKAAIFDWWIPQVEHETNIYEVISRNQDPEQPIAPLFLGHLTEQGRPMGFLMEKIDGRAACLDDLPACEEVLRKLHRMGWIHGDTNRYNFLVDRATGQVKMIDFEHAEPYEEEKARQELEGLRAELTETTGRGTSVTVVDGVEVIAGPLPYYYPPGNGSS